MYNDWVLCIQYSNTSLSSRVFTSLHHCLGVLFQLLIPPFKNQFIIYSLVKRHFIMSQQEFPGLDKLSPACSGTSTPRGNVLASHSPMSPETIKMTHRHRYDDRATGCSPPFRGKSECQRSEQEFPNEFCV